MIVTVISSFIVTVQIVKRLNINGRAYIHMLIHMYLINSVPLLSYCIACYSLNYANAI